MSMPRKLRTSTWLGALVALTGVGFASSAHAQFPQNFDTTATGALPAGWTVSGTGTGTDWVVVNDQSNSSPNSLFASDVATTSTRSVDLPAIVAAGPVTLNFWTRFVTESGFDGLQVQASINGGAFANVGQSAWRLNGYNAYITSASNTLSPSRIFSGNYPTWTNRIASIPANAGESVVFRFVMASDGSVVGTGVWVDDVNITTAATGACCTGAACSVVSSAACSTGGGIFNAAASCSTAICAQASYTEVEPNETRPTATPITLATPGDCIVGNTTGTATTTGTTSLDQFLITTPARPLGIYRNRLVLTTTGVEGHVGSIRGFTQTAAAAAPFAGIVGTATTTDAVVQTSSTTNSAPPRMNQWYGFGKQEQLYYRVTGATTSVSDYCATWTVDPVTPVNVGNYAPGQIDISTVGQGHTTDTDLWVYDSNLNAIDGSGNDGSSTNGGAAANNSVPSFLRRTYAPGTYYVALANTNLANNKGSPSDDNFRTGALLDFPNIVTNSSTTQAVNVAFAITDSAGTTQFPATRNSTFDVLWFTFTVSDALGACCASNGTCSVILGSACPLPNLYQGPASACNAGACPNTVTACCNTTTGVCVFQNGATCVAGSTATGSACSPSPCPTTGACCANTGVCSATNAAGCASPSLFQGLGTTCNAGACPVAVIACCNNTTGVCTFGAGTSCTAGSTASGSACSPTPCAPTGICCSGLGACSQIFGGSCPAGTTAATGTTCTTNPCMAPPNICQAFDTSAAGTLPANWIATVTNGTMSTGGTCQPSGWTTVNDQSHSGTNSVQANDPDRTFSQDLTMPAVSAAGPVTLNLWARWQTESTQSASFFDGWIVEVSINGSAFTNVQATPAAANPWLNGASYTGTISATFNSQIQGQRAFTGFSGGGTAPIWVELTTVVAANAGDVVQFKFRMVSDSSLGCPTNTPPYTGVWLDDICVFNVAVPPSGICCRGATCSTTITSSAACTASLIGGQTAGASFPSGAACNSGAVSSSPCCYADYNKIDGITVGDIFDFLNDWFAGSPYANTGGTGAAGPLAVQNIFDFLSNWFAGGC